MTTFTYIPSIGQDIFDVSIQFYGNIDSFPILLEDNSHINVNDSIEGVMLNIRQELPISANVALAKEYRRLGTTICNNSESGSDAWITEDGSFWITEDGNFWAL